MSALIPVIAEIVLEGIKLWSEERRTRFKSEYHEILTRLSLAQNAIGEDYVDSDVEIAEIELEIFMKAYATEVKNEVSSKS